MSASLKTVAQAIPSITGRPNLSEKRISSSALPNTNDWRATRRFVAMDNLRHDMQVNIITFKPGGMIPIEESHVMKHALYPLESKTVSLLNRY